MYISASHMIYMYNDTIFDKSWFYMYMYMYIMLICLPELMNRYYRET